MEEKRLLEKTVAYRDIDKLNEELNKVISEKLERATKRGLNQQYATTLKNRIVKRTQLGTGVDPDTATSYKFPPLSDSYKQQRRGEVRFYTDKQGRKIAVRKNENNTDYVKKPRLAQTTKPSKSNITATGQLLRSVTAIRRKVGKNIEFIFTVGDRRGRGLFDQPSTIGNKELVDILERNGRQFLGFTRSQLNQIRRDVRQFIRQFLK